VSSTPALTVAAVDGLPEIGAGADLAASVAERITDLGRGDVLVVAHKVVSKAEGHTRRLADVQPSPRASVLGHQLDKDARLVQVVLDESRELLRAEQGVLIAVTHHGFVCANAGVDVSNVPGDDTVLLLPRDPDLSARTLRARLLELTGAAPAVLITDSFGRAWRLGQCDVVIGCAGLSVLDDWRGRRDAHGRELQATWVAVADELAAAADLARTKDGRRPVVRIQGADRHVTRVDGPGAAALLRPEAEDLFR
jgi:coenzyme F420-0:L-glutamate ligase/coenzyme F420-1:gamma-L-glutamate ligase